MLMFGRIKRGDINSVRAQDYEQSPYYMSLNGTWKFNWVRNPDKRPVNFYRPDFLYRWLE